MVITIIILLILSGITIVQLTGNGLFGKAKLANQKTRYANAKEVVNLKLMEIQLDCEKNGQEYNIIKIAEGMKQAEEITIEKYYNKETASIKDGVIENTTNLEGIVVSVNEYSEYKFLIGESCEIIGVLEGKVTDTTNREDFISIEEFEKDVFQAESEQKLNTKITFEPNEYINKESTNILVNISNSKGIKSIKCPDNDMIYPQKGQTEVGIDYTVTKNDRYTYIVTDNEGKEEAVTVEVNIFDRVEPKNFIPISLKIKSTSVIIKGNAEDGDETEESAKSGIAKYQYYVNNIKKGETEKEEFEISDLIANTNYNIFLIAYDKAGNFKKSETISITTTNGSYPTLTLNGLVLPEDGVSNESGYNEILFDNDFEIFGKGNFTQSFVKFNIDSECWGKYITVYNGGEQASNLFIRMDDSPSKNKTFISDLICRLAGVNNGTNNCAYSVLIPEGVGFISVGSVSSYYTISISEIWCSEKDLTGHIYTNDNKP